MSSLDLVIVGAPGGTNVGDSFFVAARQLGLRVHMLDAGEAWRGPWPLVRVCWHLLGHRPARLGTFSRKVITACDSMRPRWLLAVGIAPVNEAAVRTVSRTGIRTLDFLTDDLWNPANRVPWAQRATRAYDCVVSPRRANMGDLSALGCKSVRYVPFGYDPRHCFPEPDVDQNLASDVIFVGGADEQRARWIAPLLSQGLHVALYGSYWDRYPQTRGKSRGQAPPDTIRRATAAAKVALCLVRRSNRDGHVMRSIEIPAIGTCMLAEDTPEHRELFGPDGESVVYFDSPARMSERVTWLLDHPDERVRLASAAHRRVTEGKYAYVHRLAEMLDLPSPA